MRLERLSFLLLCLCACLAGPARADNAVYTVENVKVDVTDKDALAAQAKAFTLAQEQGFQQLTQRLLNADALAKFKAPDDQTIATMLRDYEITAEQRSTVRYIGIYSFRFKPDAVRSYIATQSLSITENYTPAVAAPPADANGKDKTPAAMTTTTTTTTATAAPVATPPTAEIQHPFLITAHFAGLQEWLQMQKTLRGITGGPLQILALQPAMAQFNLNYSGSEDALRTALRHAHLTLMRGNNLGSDNSSRTYNLYREDDAPPELNSLSNENSDDR